jgi:NAD(P)-dependent dehydrogenase (short-subunit alcohol dehydrogenase family)
VPADAGDGKEVTNSVTEAVRLLGGLDILVNNAGVSLVARTVDTPVEEFDRLVRINLRGYFLYGQATFPYLEARRGCMVHVASDAGLRGEQAYGVYSVTKAAVVMLSAVFALDGAAVGVRSNCICPGATFPGMRHFGPVGHTERGDDRSTWSAAPCGRVGRGQDVAAGVVFLASAEADFCSGSVLLMDGGIQAGVPATEAQMAG